jgi:uncharacterized protein (TIGR02246 family)
MKAAGAYVLCSLLFAVPILRASAPAEDAIQSVLTRQVAAWNRGDLPEFVSFYAQRCTLVGASVSDTTRQQVLEHYVQKYPSPAARGKLAFSALAVHQLDSHVAVVTGSWRLDRPVTSGGSVGGVFSLVFQLLDNHWQIILDHTS